MGLEAGLAGSLARTDLQLSRRRQLVLLQGRDSAGAKTLLPDAGNVVRCVVRGLCVLSSRDNTKIKIKQIKNEQIKHSSQEINRSTPASLSMVLAELKVMRKPHPVKLLLKLPAPDS